MPLLAATQLQQHMELARQKQLKYKTRPHTWSTWSVNDRSHRSGQTINWIHGCMLWLQSTTLFHDGMPPAAVGIENKKVNGSTKTVWFATNNWTIWAKCLQRTLQIQVAQWYSALSGGPPPLNAVDYGWEADEANKCPIPRNMAKGVETLCSWTDPEAGQMWLCFRDL